MESGCKTDFGSCGEGCLRRCEDATDHGMLRRDLRSDDLNLRVQGSGFRL